MRLTIAIPTFDRNRLLVETVGILLPQLNEQCVLLVVDNASPTPVVDAVAVLAAAYPTVVLRIVRNRANVGGGGNILRCFELCETEWMWLLGDDDRVSPDAIEKIFRGLSEHPDALFFNYSSTCFTRRSEFVTTGVLHFTEGLDSFSNALFMSAGVFNAPRLLAFLRFGYIYNYSWAPHLALLIAAIGQQGKCVFATDTIIEEHCRAPAEHMWSPIGPLLGRMSLLELPLEDSARRALAAKISATPSLEYIATLLIHQQKAGNVSFDAVYAFDQICDRQFYFKRSPLRYLRVRLYRVLVKTPRLGLWVIKLTYRLLGWVPVMRRNPLRALVVVDPTNRC